jgi:hypothetical protein
MPASRTFSEQTSMEIMTKILMRTASQSTSPLIRGGKFGGHAARQFMSKPEVEILDSR